ncbi:hypothetical protein JCM18920_1121 [Cutibacterium acnes JCM 18920]|nr:hypothetical protein JCM18918_2856 [Cutibacterium acnes JCM 18918]GAE79538.1 hypothetical protein JCM18920_1121 [Cutibacterium acnes JCM 18920]
MYTYTTFAAYFEDQFFSPDDPHKSIYIYAIFWATFIMRPFGSWFFGRWADRHGRRSALTMAVTIMPSAPSSSPCCPPEAPSEWGPDPVAHLSYRARIRHRR